MDYGVEELRWENGQPAMHGVGLPRELSELVNCSTSHTYARYNNWEKQEFGEGGSSSGGGGGGVGDGGGGGTLESIVNQATTIIPDNKSTVIVGNDLISWFGVPPSTSVTMTRDALVPCTQGLTNNFPSSLVLDTVGTHVGGTSALADSCGAGWVMNMGCAAPDIAAASIDWTTHADLIASTSGTCGKQFSHQVTSDTCEKELVMAGFATTTMASLGNTTSGVQCTNKMVDDDHDDPVCRGTPKLSGRGEEGSKMKSTGKGSLSINKRSRAAAIHNQSERNRRDKINQKMKTLQKLLPSCGKTDKASMLDEVIEYLKQLKSHVDMVMKMNPNMKMNPMMLQQPQLPMPMMGGPLGMGLPGFGMGMGFMDMNAMWRNNIPGMRPVLHPSAFMQPMAMAPAPWDGSGDRFPSSTLTGIQEPLPNFLACQPQPMTMDAYTRMATLFPQPPQKFPLLGGAPTTK